MISSVAVPNETTEAETIELTLVTISFRTNQKCSL